MISNWMQSQLMTFFKKWGESSKNNPEVLITGVVLSLVFTIRFSDSQEVPKDMLLLIISKYKFIYLLTPIIKKQSVC